MLPRLTSLVRQHASMPSQWTFAWTSFTSFVEDQATGEGRLVAINKHLPKREAFESPLWGLGLLTLRTHPSSQTLVPCDPSFTGLRGGSKAVQRLLSEQTSSQASLVSGPQNGGTKGLICMLFKGVHMQTRWCVSMKLTASYVIESKA